MPVSTYRLQFNSRFRFSDARAIISYLHNLGIGDIYASPYFKAKEGSLHGYDIVDHNTLNPEIGTEGEYGKMIQVLRRYGMGQLLDIVPNHMCVASRENVWWMDVLENGPSSIYADFFDIDWEPVKKELKDKILIPILGDQYGIVLENQELQITFDRGTFFITYYDHRFPIIPKTYTDILQHRIDDLERLLSPEDPHLQELLSIITALNYLPPYTETNREKIEERYREKEIIKKRLWNLYNASPEIRSFIDDNVKFFNGTKGNPRSFDLLDNLLSRQTYRLSFWRVATEEINYRRFFDINELGAIRVESPGIFEETHRLLFSLIREGKVTGLRVDHPDGLYNPVEYFHLLQLNCFLHLHAGPDVSPDNEKEIIKRYEEILSRDGQYKPFYIVGEKILIRGERMPDDWPIFSTTGYVFLNTLNGIFVDITNAKAFDEIYERFTNMRLNLQEIIYEKKKLIMKVAMSSEVNMLGHYLDRISEKNRHTKDFTLNSLTIAIIEVTAFFPVYRTYITPSGVNERDRRYIDQAVSRAKRKNPAISESVFNFLKAVLLLDYPADFIEVDRQEWIDFVMRFQQLTGPIMAKGVEDTAFYVYNRFVSLNEVGGSPDRFGTPVETFHGQNMERLKFWPHALIATSTHDTKRGEDVRARINVLSEIPKEWKDCLVRWRRWNRKKKITLEGQPVPDPNDEYLLYQTLIGAYPLDPDRESAHEDFKKRFRDYMLKAVREAKVNTSWISPNRAYEEALIFFIDAVFSRTADNRFLKDFESFQKRVSHYGLYNSLSQMLLKIASPGVPDFYQGTEIWDFSLVDPDNRRPVDYEIRMGMLEELKKKESEISPSELARDLTLNRGDGKIKLYLSYKALNFRREKRDLFERGDYEPLEAAGDKANHIAAFSRILGNDKSIIIVPRFFTRLIPQPEDLPLGRNIWGDSSVRIRDAGTGERYRNIFTGEVVTVSKYNEVNVLCLSEVFLNFPVALLESERTCDENLI
ncbi:MAG: malto-oligosyltrehalose synthase [Nitrospirae bacterium]|nr:malto-oligosyltrehalose synthase [Nitrospirota bacterium]